ncbi:MAG: FAD-dependent oxidoreductase [Thermodesulfobacteriaceae bacterium]|nr:FAD-dependent oxidoreductase [Thermodesulfobacteriaceae bacterium]MDW8135871.1 FAD-dependent oxidoreductase [Thermodesulfobacterium sp.]
MNKVGIVFCTCGETLREKIDFKALEEVAQGLEGVSEVLTVSLLCKNPEKILDPWKGKVTHLLIGACSERSSLNFSEERILKLLDYLGINQGFFETVNLREQCAWIHRSQPISKVTGKAIDMLLMAHTKLLLNQPAVEIRNLVPKVLVVGGGVSGLSAALGLANLELKVTLVEKEPYLGGTACKIPFLWQSEGSYSFCTSECVIPVLTKEVLFSDKVEVFTSTQVRKVSKEDGNFKVTLLKAPEYVNPERCISCGKCKEVCPVTVPNPFEFGNKEKKAIDKEFFLHVPDIYFLDSEACNFCGNCVEVCPTQAINLKAKPKVMEKTVGAIIVASGFYPATLDETLKTYPQIKLKSSKIITLTQFERLIAYRFFGKPPLSIVFILCSKDQVGYCSKLCCNIVAKHAFRLANFYPGTQVTVVYQELAPLGRHGEFFLKTALQKGVELIKTTVEGIEEGQEGWLVIKTPEGDYEADLVVLAEPLVYAASEILKQLQVPTDSSGFPIESQEPKIIRPGETYVDRVFITGAAKGFKDVQESVESGAYVAWKAYVSLKGEVKKFVSQIDPLRCCKCLTCTRICPHGAIEVRKKTFQIYIDPAFCKGCGLCVSVCPTKSISLRNLTEIQLLNMLDKAFVHADSEEARVVAFLCYWCAYAAADLAGPKGFEFPINSRTIKIRCSASIDPSVLIKILASQKADKILIAGCPPQNCHHLKGNYLADRRINFLKETLETIGLSKELLRYEPIGVVLSDQLTKILISMIKKEEKLKRKVGRAP